MMQLYLKRKFDAAHFLPSHPGKCKNMHGHSFKGEFWLQGPLNQELGMMIDFGDVKKIVDHCDHALLNDVLPDQFLPPTAENLALYFLYEIPHCVRARVWESETCFAQATAKPPRDTGRLGSQYSNKWDPPDWRWLDREYNWSKKSATQIAREVGTGPKVVIKWLKRVGISPRTLTQAQGLRRQQEFPHLEGQHSLRTCRRHAEAALWNAEVPVRCASCGIGPEDSWIEVHHLDGNERNNLLENLQWLCRSCHMYTRREQPSEGFVEGGP